MGQKTGQASYDVPQKGSTFAPDFRKRRKFGVFFYKQREKFGGLGYPRMHSPSGFSTNNFRNEKEH